MIPEKGQQVKCFLRFNAMVLEGKVEEWSNNQIILRSLTDDSLMIIHCSADILLTKVMPAELSEIKEKPVEEIKQEISETLSKVLKQPTDNDLAQVNLKRLRMLKEQQEKSIISSKKKAHFGVPGSSKMAVPYTDPTNLFIKKGD